MSGVTSVLEIIKNYTGESILGIVFLMCLISMISKEEKKNRNYIIWIIVLSVVFVFNDISMKFMGLLTDSATYYRFLWAVPVTVVIAHVLVETLTREKEKTRMVAIAGLCVMILALGGATYLNKENLQYPGSTEKIPGDIKTICRIIEENKIEERPVCVFDQATLLMVRSENPSIVWGVKRNAYIYFMENGYDSGKYKNSEKLIKVVNSGIEVKKRKLKKIIKRRNVEFLVIKKEFQMTEYLSEIGVYPVGESDNYIVYQYDKGKKE